MQDPPPSPPSNCWQPHPTLPALGTHPGASRPCRALFWDKNWSLPVSNRNNCPLTNRSCIVIRRRVRSIRRGRKEPGRRKYSLEKYKHSVGRMLRPGLAKKGLPRAWGEQSTGGMEKSSYPMAKFGLEAKEVMPKRDCGFYVKYIFLFTSLIQFLIILGLVLFMVYGNAQAGTDTHLRLLEEQLQDRYSKIIALGERNINLTRTLNATLKEKQSLQALAQKVQRELEKCNSSQTPNPIPKVSTHPWGGMAKPPVGYQGHRATHGYCKHPQASSPTSFSRDG